ncbi:hypothetical protein Q73_11955 [Bacillus coahuilensis m2-6]|uniref:Uncharacterized protein n=1 Tax=Bacillus coahuilensis p1.1.43 TaxID=1150625 RepID=A0A147K6D3_9BACI|nr:hypothetical protein [Bacillus coahuilensis]KUP05347.1 hypothetical protein Q75_12550 [Bacillus coahuilensis p1.1.43]KUP06090.1 hypothetical protein Q73_11955 [Bacillus coahuilensis m2-6]
MQRKITYTGIVFTLLLTLAYIAEETRKDRNFIQKQETKALEGTILPLNNETTVEVNEWFQDVEELPFQPREYIRIIP